MLKPAALLSATCLTLSACVSVLPEPTAPDAVYQLGLGGEIDRQEELTGTVVVREPDGPRLLIGRQITATEGNGALSVLGTAQWADNASLMLQFSLIDRLNAYAGNGVAVSNASGTRGDVEVHWRLQEFSLTGSDAVVSFTLSLLDGRTRAPLAQKRVTVREPGDEVADLMRAIDLTLDDAASFVRDFMAGRDVA